jgi:hypothetical protein
MSHRLPLLAGALLALAISSSPARATVVVDRSVPLLAAKADLVVRGTVLSTKVQWNERHDLILTKTTIKPTEALKGDASQAVVIVQIGGSLDGVNMPVSGTASFAEGEDVVVFLEKVTDTTSGEMVLETMAASKFTVVKTATGFDVTRSTQGLALARPDDQGILRIFGEGTDGAGRMSYDELVRQVRQNGGFKRLAPGGR